MYFTAIDIELLSNKKLLYLYLYGYGVGLVQHNTPGESDLVALWESLFETLYCLCAYCFCVKMVPLHYCSDEE